MPIPGPMNPVVVQNLVCYYCGTEMYMRLEQLADGKVQRALYTCPKCEYSHDLPNLPFSYGISRPAKDGELEAAKKAQAGKAMVAR